MDELTWIEIILYSLISLFSFFALGLFIPHTVLSSSDDTPLIFYRYLMILAGLLLFLYNIIINFNGIHQSHHFEIKTLCQFLDWMYYLIVIPLAVPFVSNVISAAETASKLSMFKQHKMSLVPEHSHKDDNTNEHSIITNKYSKIMLTFINFIAWLAALICQIMSWYTNDSFYRKIIFAYILDVFIGCASLFVALSFISLYREVNQVQKTFIKIQQSISTIRRSSLSDNPNHKNDNSVSVHNDAFPMQKTATINEEVIQNLARHKSRFVKITAFVIVLATVTVYGSFAKMEREHHSRYSILVLYEKPHNYVIYCLGRLMFTCIMYQWLSISNLYSKKAPMDSIAYLFYAHCCCQLEFCCCYLKCIRTMCDHNIDKDKVEQGIEMENIPRIIEFKDDINYRKSKENSHSNKTLPSTAPNFLANTNSSDDYANIDNIAMFEVNNNTTQLQTGTSMNTLPSKKMNIRIIKSSKENNFDNFELPRNGTLSNGYSNKSSNKSSRETTKTNTKHLHAYNNTMTLPTYGDNGSPTAGTIAAMNMEDNEEEYSCLPTYEEKIHGNNGLCDESANMDNFKSFSLGSGADSPIFPSPNSYPYPSILKKSSVLPDIRMRMGSDSAMVSVESDSDNTMIMGIKAVVYCFDILMENMKDINGNDSIDNYETKIKRLSQHFLIMNDNIKYVFIVSEKVKNEMMFETLEIIHLKNCFQSNENAYNIIGCDHEWVNHCKKNVQLILLSLVQKLKIENNELLFVASKKLTQTIKSCQTYNVSNDLEDNRNKNDSRTESVLQGKDLMFLESQVLASI